MITFSLVAFLAAFALAALLTPLARRLAIRMDLVAPVRSDRLHTEPRPYGGSAAILATLFILGFIPLMVCTLLAVRGEALVSEQHLRTLNNFQKQSLPLLGGILFFYWLGLIDDRLSLSAWIKLPVELTIAAYVVWGLGLRATVWLSAPYAGDVVSILWIVALVNAYNMLDHADGLAAAAGAVALIALAAGQMLVDVACVPVAALMTAGALSGFLIYNFPPAKLFMGDAGTMLVGFLLAALTIQGRYYYEGLTPSRLVVLIPLALLAVPLFDMVCVVAARLWRRQNPMKGDATSHLAHRMLARGWSPRGIVAFAAGATAVTGAASVSMYFLSGPALLLPWLGVAGVLAAMLLVRRPPRRSVQSAPEGRNAL